ncbi:MAG: hypothetical protein RR359_02980 [Bacilli bacterium]
MKKKVVIFLLVFSCFLAGCTVKPIDSINKDAINFAKEYDISEKNPFKYKTDKEIIKILTEGTGIIYFGFPECPWCKGMMKEFNNALNEKKVKEAFYFNPMKIRSENTKEYKEIVRLLDKYLANDKDGNKRLYVPEVVIVKNGEILGNNLELSKINNISGNTEEYFTETKNKEIKQSFIDMIEKLYSTDCHKC